MPGEEAAVTALTDVTLGLLVRRRGRGSDDVEAELLPDRASSTDVMRGLCP